MHRHYEELCALAATGQIDTGDEAGLQEHLSTCSECRAFLDDVVHVGMQGAPVVAASQALRASVQPPLGIRERFLDRAAAAGLNVSPGPVLAESPKPGRRRLPVRNLLSVNSPPAWRVWQRIPPIQPLYAAMALASCVVFGILGYLLGVARHPARITTPVAAVSNSATPSGTADRIVQLTDQEKTKLEQKLRAVSGQLAAAEGEKRDLSRNLADVVKNSAVGERFEEQFKAKAKDLQDAEDRIAKLKSELELAQQKQSETETILIAQEQVTQDANAKLAKAKVDLQTEHDLVSARSEIGDLISARNLHIVDVHDAEPGGKRQRAFGRVFYVEGQSLVFYAYDLAANHPEKKVVFHVWGETAGVKETTHSLGILHSDNPNQARWVLTFDDPKILNRINAVYVTAEQGATPKDDPQGRQLLYAFLGSPNHP
jgi:hypothetical protein